MLARIRQSWNSAERPVQPPASFDDRRTNRVPLTATQLPAECALARLDVRLREIEDRRATTVTKVGPQHLNQRGQVQGGVYGVLADAAAGWATEAFLGGAHYVTTALSGQLFGAVSSGDVIRSEAEITHGGRTTVVCTVRLWRERILDSPALVAMFTCQQLVLSIDRPPAPGQA
jgi:uncharacterized protein (TIGR00369 family)